MSTRLLSGAVGLVLRLGPRTFRDEYGEAIVRDFGAVLRAERQTYGMLAMMRTWVLGLLDAVRTVLRERATGRGSPRGVFTDVGGDVRYVMRSWRRTPGFAVTILLTLILGLGFTSAIFAFADGYLFRPLPFPAADRLFFVRDPDAAIAAALRASDTAALRTSAVSHLGFVEWGSAGGTALPSMGELIVGDRRVSLRVDSVSRGFAEVVQLPFAAGRPFTPEDHRGAAPVPIWLSHRAWQREFGGDRSVIGRRLTITGPAKTAEAIVVGIMARQVTAFDGNNPPPEIVAPSAELDARSFRPTLLSFPIVRLPSEMSVEQAEAAIGSALQGVAPGPAGKVRRVRLSSVYANLVHGGRPTAQVFGAGAVLVVILVIINLLHLLLTRSVARANELATRAALGGSRTRLVRLFAVESLALAGVGIAGGLVLGAALTEVIGGAVPTFPTAGRNLSLVVMSFDARVVGFAGILGLVIVLFGTVWPAWRSLRRPLTVGIRNAAGMTDHVTARFSRAMLASEIAVAAVIMIGAAFMSLGIWRYLNQPLGFDIQDRIGIELTTSVAPSADVQPDWSQAIELARGVPGIAAISLYGTSSMGPVDVADGRKPDKAYAAAVSHGYFDAWGIRPIAGRVFHAWEIAGNVPVAVVDEKFARVAWPEQSAIGKIVRTTKGTSHEVIGVTPVERRRLSVDLPGAAYVPLQQEVDRVPFLIAWAPGIDPVEVARRLTQTLNATIPGIRVQATPVTRERLFARDLGEAVFQQPIVAMFGIFTFALAAVGVFGLVSYLAEQRRREFGIRIALGARPGHLWQEVLRQGFLPAVVGLAMGVAIAAGLENVVEATVFGWQSSGWIATSTVAAALLLVTAVAIVSPARRVLHIDPATVLRAE